MLVFLNYFEHIQGETVISITFSHVKDKIRTSISNFPHNSSYGLRHDIAAF